ncbi:MAG: ABC transporter permease [Acidimicrobiales bacterium]|nr:ABC transporter permease [Actinomycetota bacterium]
MTVLETTSDVEPEAPVPPGPEADDHHVAPTAAAQVQRHLRTALRWAVVIASTVAIFSAFLLAKGADPASVLESMWKTALGTPDSAGETFIRATPLLLAALAAAVPARAGLFNLGGEGQLLMGAIGAILVANQLDGGAGTWPTLVLMAAGGAALGALWAAIPAVLKVATRTNEAISSLLLNYIAGLVVTWLCFEPWKDPASLGQAYSRELTGPERFPIIWGQRVHAGIFVGLVAALVLWALLRWSTWGFKLRVLGGNPSAARRAGLAVGGLSIAAMVVGGAMAGLGGMIEVAGTEGRLRPELLAGYGFIGFLASWLARHDPLRCIGAAVVLGAIAVGGSGLKITAGLSGGAVNILMAVVLLAVLGWGGRKAEAAR